MATDRLKYSPITMPSDEDLPLLGEDYNKDSVTRPKPRRVWQWTLFILPWLSTVILACVCLYLALYSSSRSTCLTHWAPTEFGPAKEYIDTQVVSFSGGVSFDENGHMYKPHPSKYPYGGVGSEVDKQWDILTFGRYFLVSEEEARHTFGETYKDLYNPQMGGYVIGLDMFHTLHCLNNLRKLIHPEYYPKSDDPRAKMHDSHCIDQLRQQVMCAGDATPVPVKWHSGVGRGYVDSDVQHTCRNFGKLQNFTRERFYRSAARVRDLLIHG